MPIQANDVLKACWQVLHTNPNTRAQNIYYWQITDLVDPTDANVFNDIGDRLVEMYTTVQAQLTTGYTLENIKVTNVTKRELVGEGVAPGTFDGTDAGEALPAQNAAEVLARSRTLGHVGRKYIGPLAESAVNDGELTVGAFTNFEAFVNIFDATFTAVGTGNTYVPGTASFNVGGGLQQFRAFASDLQKTVLGIRIQRRRRPNVGLS